jgi:hypothetical protein
LSHSFFMSFVILPLTFILIIIHLLQFSYILYVFIHIPIYESVLPSSIFFWIYFTVFFFFLPSLFVYYFYFIFLTHFFLLWVSLATRLSRVAVSIGTDCRLNDLGIGVRVPVGSRIFTSPYCPDRLWGPLGLLSSEYGE